MQRLLSHAVSLVLVVTSAALAQPARPARPLSVSEVVKRATPAVVSLRTFDRHGNALGLGSGFVVEGGRVVTNAHVVEGASRIEVFDFEGKLMGSTDYAEALSARNDLAILPAMPHPRARLALSLDEPAVGTAIIAIGSPQGLTNTVSTGIVSAYREKDGVRWMQISAPISQGSSGGPILDEKGLVVAVSVAILQVGQNLNFAVPARNVRALVDGPKGRIALHGADSSDSQKDASSIFRSLPLLSAERVREESLDDEDLALDSGQRIEGFHFEGRAGDEVTIMAVSDEFDVNLTVFDSDEEGAARSLGTDDDGAGGTNARLTLRLRRDGPVGVFVSSAEADDSGAYRVGIIRDQRVDQPARHAAGGPRWVPVATGTGRSVTVDRQTVRRGQGARVTAWQRTAFETPQQNSDGVSYDRAMSLVEYDCRARMFRLLEHIQYAGEHVAHSERLNPPSPWAHLIPDSVGEVVAHYLCSP